MKFVDTLVNKSFYINSAESGYLGRASAITKQEKTM